MRSTSQKTRQMKAAVEAILFAMGVAIGMAKKEKEVAALSAAIAFFIMHASISALITINGGTEAMLAGAVTSVCGITSLQMGVFGGILVGLGVAALHNRFYKIELPQVLSFFGGSRFVPIICRNLGIWIYGTSSDTIWPASCVLSAILADCGRRNAGGWRACCRRSTEYLLCTAGRPKYKTFCSRSM